MTSFLDSTGKLPATLLPAHASTHLPDGSDPVSVKPASGAPMPTGALAETFGREVTSVGNSLTSGTGRLALVQVRKGVTYTAANWCSGGTALATPTHQWAALVSTAGVVLAVSADDTSGAWAANTVKTFTFAAAYTPPADAAVYVLVLVAATTPPNLASTTPLAALTALVPVSAAQVSGLTTPVAVGASIGSIASFTAVSYAYLT